MRRYTVMLHGGVCHRTSITHKSGNKMKRNTNIDLAFLKMLAH